MKHTLLIILMASAVATFAQVKVKKDWGYDVSDNCYYTNRTYLGIQYGMPFIIKKYWETFSKNGNYNVTGISPIGIQIEHALSMKWSITLGYLYTQQQAVWGVAKLDTIENKKLFFDKGFIYKSQVLYAGINKHLFVNKKVDVYFGANLGYDYYTYKAYSNLPNDVMELPEQHLPIYYFGYLGAKYFVVKRAAVFAQVGYGSTQQTLVGLQYRFGL